MKMKLNIWCFVYEVDTFDEKNINSGSKVINAIMLILP